MEKQLTLPKQRVKEFCKTGYEEPFVFEYRGTKSDAEKFIHKMRVELSRLRGKVREQGYIPTPWKMILISIEEITKLDENKQSSKLCRVTLKKTKKGVQALEDLSEIMDLVQVVGQRSNG